MRWDYKVVEFKEKSFFGGKLKLDALAVELTTHGRAGWELVSMMPLLVWWSEEGVVMTFKRPLN